MLNMDGIVKMFQEVVLPMPVWRNGEVTERVRGRKNLFDGKMNIPDAKCHSAYNRRRNDGFHKKDREYALQVPLI